MKQSLMIGIICLLAMAAQTQNVGIGTIAPQTKLHIVSPTDEVLRLDANYPFVSLYTGGVYQGYLWKSFNSIEVGSATGSNLPITLAPNGFQRFYIGTNGNVGIGTLNPIQKLQVEGATYLNGNVGISNSNPLFPLSFNGNTGDKISLWNDGTSTHYGFGIQGGLLQVFSKTNIDDIAFGYGSSNSFTERMRIKGNGNVGIGNADPGFLLDVNNRIRIRSGGDFSNTAGIWLNKTDNSALQSFIGIENDNYIGFYGLTAGWKFSVNTQTGALKINGSEGQAGHVLQSNGGAAASWASPTNTLYNNTTIVYGTSSAAQGFPAGIPDVPILGLTHTFTVSGNAKVLVSFNVPPHTNGCSGCNPSHVSIKMKLNNSHIATYREYLPALSSTNISSTHLLQVGPGTHTIQLFGEATEQDFLMYGNSTFRSNYMIVQIISQ